ncbi:DUF5324 family protein [Streptomyces sp. NPDC005389]|uniref:DUF5324 family protein n=1 Tax=Streptomyces sp. NPDC005389 TaxID=3157040 RepID=UPI0033B73E6F
MASAGWFGSTRRRASIWAAAPPGFRPGHYCPFCGCRLSKGRHHPACPVASAPESLLNALLRQPKVAAETERLLRRGPRLHAGRRLAKHALVWAAAGGAALAAWRWWDRRTNPDWLVEPPSGTASLAHEETEANFGDWGD